MTGALPAVLKGGGGIPGAVAGAVSVMAGAEDCTTAGGSFPNTAGGAMGSQWEELLVGFSSARGALFWRAWISNWSFKEDLFRILSSNC